MNHWWRAYNTAASDPKLGELTDWQHRCWFQIMCMASENDGKLPILKHVAFTLRVRPEKAAEVISQLHVAGLLDKTEDGFVPHNWNGRQYKSDVSTDRVKRFRNGKRNVSVNDERNAPEQSRPEQKRADTEARDPLKVRTGDFQQAIVRAFAAANSPNLPETSRAGLWLSQGFQEDICLAVITDIVKRKPSITTLSYFDKPIADAHAKKAPPREAVVMTAEETDWEAVCKSYKAFGQWSKWAGPDPDSEACRCPRDVLAKHGLLPISDAPSLPTPTMPSMQ